jgi:hypothetical protein
LNLKFDQGKPNHRAFLKLVSEVRKRAPFVYKSIDAFTETLRKYCCCRCKKKHRGRKEKMFQKGKELIEK